MTCRIADELVEQVVGLAQADAQPLGQLALVEAGFGGDDVEDVEDAQLLLFLGCHFYTFII